MVYQVPCEARMSALLCELSSIAVAVLTQKRETRLLHRKDEGGGFS
jgi:hypothetical protein